MLVTTSNDNSQFLSFLYSEYKVHINPSLLACVFLCFGDRTTQLGVFCVEMEHKTPCNDSGGDRHPHV